MLLSFMVTILAGTCGFAGFENFSNFPNPGGTYSNGTFTGQDGSTWTFVSCRGDKPISAPSPTLNRGASPAASITSGTLTGGCGSLSFKWMQAFANPANLNVLVNGLVIGSVTGGPQNVTNASPVFTVNQAGNFVLSFVQSNTAAGQVTLDDVNWTAYSGGGSNPQPPQLVLSPASTNIAVSYNANISITASATEPNGDTVSLWVPSVPTGAVFNGVTGASPVQSVFNWTPSLSETGEYTVTFFAGDKDGTNNRSVHITVHGIRDYYADAEGLSGSALRQALHDIITSNSYQLDNLQEDAAMKKLHEDPGNTNNIIALYSGLSMPKSMYNQGGGWNKEHSWPTSRGLGSSGPDENDVHNLFAADSLLNANRGNLYFDESNSSDPGYTNPAATNAPECSFDSDSWEPEPSMKGDLARALFYMAVRYDGSQADTLQLDLTNIQLPTSSNRMGILTTMLAWHASDPPNAWESNRNNLVYTLYQTNRNPFIDHPEWVASIWETNATPPVLSPIGSKTAQVGTPLSFGVQALPTEGDTVTLSISNAPVGSQLFSTNENGVFTWTPLTEGVFSPGFYASDNDGADSETVNITVGPGTQSQLLVHYTFDNGIGGFTATPATVHANLSAGTVSSHDGSVSSLAGSSGQAVSDTGWNVSNLTAFFTCTINSTGTDETVFTGLSFEDRASASGAQFWRVRSGADGFAADLGSGSAHSDFATNRITFSNPITTAGSSIIFRIHGQLASSSAGTWRMDNLQLLGYTQQPQADPDVDGDGMDDAWEAEYLGSTSAMADGNPDADWMNNIEEYVAGTHPSNALSEFSATISRTGESMYIHSSASATNRRYALETITSLATQSWQEIAATNPSAPDTAIFLIASGSVFRVRAVPP